MQVSQILWEPTASGAMAADSAAAQKARRWAPAREPWCRMGGRPKAKACFPCQRVKTRAIAASLRRQPDANRG